MAQPVNRRRGSIIKALIFVALSGAVYVIRFTLPRFF